MTTQDLEADVGPVSLTSACRWNGFIGGLDDGPGNPLGDGGGRLFDWWTAGTERTGPDDLFKPPARSRAVAREIFDSRAVITGRRTFDIARGWGGHHPLGCPFFLLTHNPPDRWTGPGTGGTAVTDGIESALKQARAVDCAACTAQQFLNAGRLDEIRLSLVPVVLGGGVRPLDNLGGQQLSLEFARG
jgi:dihydrofolate reductase